MRQENLVVSLGVLPDMSPASGAAYWRIFGLMFRRRSDDMAAVNLADVPVIVLSEALRDVDLLISVAGTGGTVESSAATVALRRALASELSRLLKLANVSFEGHKILIEGRKGQYSLHLGSGQVHRAGRGIYIEAVPGAERLFLPFADDDPGTSEVMSKMLLLAEDELIKDPSILAQLG
jgi:acyl transferase domain-containing protein